jgi:hypothetical protein
MMVHLFFISHRWNIITREGRMITICHEKVKVKRYSFHLLDILIIILLTFVCFLLPYAWLWRCFLLFLCNRRILFVSGPIDVNAIWWIFGFSCSHVVTLETTCFERMNLICIEFPTSIGLWLKPTWLSLDWRCISSCYVDWGLTSFTVHIFHLKLTFFYKALLGSIIN